MDWKFYMKCEYIWSEFCLDLKLVFGHHPLLPMFDHDMATPPPLSLVFCLFLFNWIQIFAKDNFRKICPCKSCNCPTETFQAAVKPQLKQNNPVVAVTPWWGHKLPRCDSQWDPRPTYPPATTSYASNNHYCTWATLQSRVRTLLCCPDVTSNPMRPQPNQPTRVYA